MLPAGPVRETKVRVGWEVRRAAVVSLRMHPKLPAKAGPATMIESPEAIRHWPGSPRCAARRTGSDRIQQ